jgi:7-carboxy-7-deazaguanine synthase
MMTYAVKECLLTLQGEGARTGRVAVLCRMSGCNLWSGRTADQPAAACSFCDTDFVGTDGIGGGSFEAEGLANHIDQSWRSRLAEPFGVPYVVFTGGEPLLQLDRDLVDACHDRGFEVAIETNGTLACPPTVDWVCVSPKSTSDLMITRGHELKLVYPQRGLSPKDFEHLQFQHWFLQPMDGPQRQDNTRACIDYCLAHPRWRLSVQVHKMIGVR